MEELRSADAKPVDKQCRCFEALETQEGGDLLGFLPRALALI